MERGNIALIGASGSGKTSVGKALAALCGLDFFDTDKDIEKTENMPIPEIFERLGEPYFRASEADAVNRAACLTKTVISTGGGCCLNPVNMQKLKETGVIVYLLSDAETIYRNIRHDSSRPLLQTDDKLKKIREMLAARVCLYEKYAELTVDVRGVTVAAAAELIKRGLLVY